MTSKTRQVSPAEMERIAPDGRGIEIDSDNDRAYFTVAGITYWCQLDLAAVAA